MEVEAIRHLRPMNAPQISTRVLEFLADKIDTVPELEALLLMWQAPGRFWSAEDVAARTYVSVEHSRTMLQNLQRRHLVVAEHDSSLYRYDGAWDASGSLMPEVELEYRRRLIPIATFIHSRASFSVREFARAFHLKKER